MILSLREMRATFLRAMSDLESQLAANSRERAKLEKLSRAIGVWLDLNPDAEEQRRRGDFYNATRAEIEREI
jgi:hypothetical protein